MLTTYTHSGGWCIVPIHYSMDPDKDPLWAAENKRKYPLESDWDMEMEISFQSVAGVLAYPNFSSSIHVDASVRMIANLPLFLACDFNMKPMVWEIGQIFRRTVHFLDEVVGLGISIQALCTQFRNAYPTHTAPLWVYGDASGTHNDAQTAQSNFDLLRLGLQGYPVPIEWKIERANPPVLERLASVNTALRDADGRSWVKIHPRCTYLIADMQEVVRDDKSGIKKMTDQLHPYSQRTHASDAAGYMIHREFPVYRRLQQDEPARRRPIERGRLLGEL